MATAFHFRSLMRASSLVLSGVEIAAAEDAAIRFNTLPAKHVRKTLKHSAQQTNE
jgi:hypothetical protein